MIPLSTSVCQEIQQETLPDKSWQRVQAQAVRSVEELLTAVDLSSGQIPGGITASSEFPLRVPHGYVQRMQAGDPADPLLLQVLPRQVEHHQLPGYDTDPVGDHAATVVPGLLQKYRGRVLLITTAACPVHCRYCFRRHYPYSDNQLGEEALAQAITHIAADDSIHEVILSGGDPLSLSNDRLTAITRQLASISHIQRLRIHTRTPIVLPERIDRGLLDWLASLPWPCIVVTHSNHANEIDDTVLRALLQLKQSGATLLNQAVLLQGVNATAAAQIALSERLFQGGVLPYYLHLLDKVQGAGHFEVCETTARNIMEALRRHLPGFLVPRLVRETAGHPYKEPITA